MLILPFTKDTGPNTGLVPTGSFNYTLFVDSSDGTFDVQEGKIDFGKELTPDLNSFVVDSFTSAEITATGAAAGKLLWLFPNDHLITQAKSESIKPTTN